MGNIAPLDAVADAIAWYFCQEISGLKTLRGWPEPNVDLDLANDEYGQDYSAVLSVFVDPNYELERIVPTEACREQNEDGTLEVLYRVAYVTGRIQLDLWAPYRHVRDVFTEKIIAKSANRLPFSSELQLTSSGFFGRDGYYDRLARIDLQTTRNRDEGDSVERNEWRKTWTATVLTDILLPKTHPKINELTLNATIQRGAISVTESRTIVPTP